MGCVLFGTTAPLEPRNPIPQLFAIQPCCVGEQRDTMISYWKGSDDEMALSARARGGAFGVEGAWPSLLLFVAEPGLVKLDAARPGSERT